MIDMHVQFFTFVILSFEFFKPNVLSALHLEIQKFLL